MTGPRPIEHLWDLLARKAGLDNLWDLLIRKAGLDMVERDIEFQIVGMQRVCAARAARMETRTG